MRKVITNSFPVCLAALVGALAGGGRAQVQSTTRIVDSSAGATYSVDGQQYTQTTSFIWPQGSKHTLYAPPAVALTGTTQYAFQDWQWSGGALPGNPAVVTADPSITEYTAVFSVQYLLNVSFYTCAGGPCQPPGTVYIGGTPYTTSQQLFEGAGSTVTLQAFPNPGYVFVGWSSGGSQAITGFQNNVTVNGPLSVNAIFAPTRTVNFATIPAGLAVLADRTLITSPGALDWGFNTTHTVSAESPQVDPLGNYWVFSSWSDGGALSHAYTVAPVYGPDTLIATYVQGVPVGISTAPAGLNLSVDGRVNWPTYVFTWGVGETHNIQAMTPQTDSSGHAWQFSGWSDGVTTAARAFTVPTPSGGANGVRLTATYSPMGHLTVTSAQANLSVTVNGNACAVPCDILEPAGSQVAVTAPASITTGPGTRQDFLGWSNGAQGPLTLTLGGDPVTVSANYHTMNYLGAAASPSGAVSFTMQPGSPDGFYDFQTQVTVTAAAQPGFRFRNWSGDLSGTLLSGTLSMNAPHAIQAMADPVAYISPAGVVNGAGTTPQTAVAPGSVASLFGLNLSSGVFLGQGNPLVQTLGGLTAHMGDRLLPLFFVSPTQINLQLPDDLAPGPQNLSVSVQGQPDIQVPFTVAQDAPGLFPQVIDGQTFAVAVHADGSSVTPTAPAAQGEVLTVYGTGFGATTPARPEGFAVPDTPAYPLVDTASIQVGGVAVQPTNAFALAGSIGVDAIQFLIAPGLPTATNAQLTITVNGQASNTLLLPLQ